jgi:hypothetical protein
MSSLSINKQLQLFFPSFARSNNLPIISFYVKKNYHLDTIILQVALAIGFLIAGYMQGVYEQKYLIK